MASLYQRIKRVGTKKIRTSPFWWIKYKSPDKFVTAKDGTTTYVIVREPTPYRVGVGHDTKRAEELRAQHTLREAQCAGTNAAEWDTWVPSFFNLHYGPNTSSRERAQASWRTMRMFLREREIKVPAQFTRAHCGEYMKWREKPNKSIGKYKARPNTARSELIFLGLVMKEAVRRGFAKENPCAQLGIRRQAVRLKPELTEAAVKLIREKIETEPEPLRTFFRNSFEIAYHHGVRLSGTYLNPMTAVYQSDQGQWRITFTHKGKTRAKILHPNLIPLFQKLRAENKTETYAPQPSPAKTWWRFLTRHGVKKLLPGVCFHSTRVTVASKLARKGIPEKHAMEFVDHASTTVHRSYVRLQPDDLQDCIDAIT